MVKIYDNIKDENGIESPNRTKLFITKTGVDGSIIECLLGNYAVPMTNGTMFIVDNWLIDQLDKVIFKDGTLQVKDGERLDEPVKSEKEKQREELLRQLALLDADTEEQSDEP